MTHPLKRTYRILLDGARRPFHCSKVTERVVLTVAFWPLAVAWPSRVSAQGCVVQGTSVNLERVVVHAARGTFRVNTSFTPMSAQVPRRRGEPTMLTVGGLVSFRGWRTNVWYSVTSSIDTADAMVHLEPGAPIVDAYVDANAVVANLVLRSECANGTGIADRPDEILTSARLPCGALGLVDQEPRWLEQSTSRPILNHELWWTLRTPTNYVRLFSKPTYDSQSVLVSVLRSDFSEGIDLQQLTVKGSWIKVVRWGDQVSVTGWVPRSRLQLIPSEFGRTGDCTPEVEIDAVGHVVGATAGLYSGPVNVAANTRVFGEFGEWGVITKSVKLSALYVPGERWVALPGGFPGLSGLSLLTASVPVSSVTFP